MPFCFTARDKMFVDSDGRKGRGNLRGVEEGETISEYVVWEKLHSVK